METSRETHKISQRTHIIKRAQADKKPDFQGKADEIPAIPKTAGYVKKPCAVA
ncbi:hypothetical protein [Cardiobacterium hominis]|uniref:hypothetical protein n=1 Tax=Cardiobacterium hominis TaxID=2718 RepID=UPI000AD97C0F|nr:hypothetical protein [Cardiobacterium hominis]